MRCGPAPQSPQGRLGENLLPSAFTSLLTGLRSSMAIGQRQEFLVRGLLRKERVSKMEVTVILNIISEVTFALFYLLGGES